MSEYSIRLMKAAEFKDFYKRIENDFSPDEHSPYAVMHQQLQNGIQDGLVLCEGKRDLAYCICVANHESGYVLISLFAVFEEVRGQGIGTEFMKALCNRYGHKQAMFVEVEKPELSQTSEELDFRKRRISFYEKAGFYLIQGIDYTIWDVPMHLMALPIKVSKEIINQQIGQLLYQIYFKLLGKRFIHKMEFRTVGE